MSKCSSPFLHSWRFSNSPSQPTKQFHGGATLLTHWCNLLKLQDSSQEITDLLPHTWHRVDYRLLRRAPLQVA